MSPARWQAIWSQRGWSARLLWPISLLHAALGALRRNPYRHGVLTVHRLPVPVVVVGNVVVGGAGKTPLLMALIRHLQAQGWHPGVVSRGYGRQGDGVLAVLDDTPARLSGDEPALIRRSTRVPVYVAARRVEAARALLRAQPQVDLLLCDDGLQHLALARDMEIVVVDGRRAFGNARLLPAGPLREPLARLAEVDAVVVNGGGIGGLPAPTFAMALRGSQFVNLGDPARVVDASHFRGRTVRALAGIGDPARFFERLRELGLDIEAHAFPDHHPYSAADLPAGTLLMTEKDAVKCAAFARPDDWFLSVDAEVEAGLNTLLSHVMKARHGSQAA